MWKTAAYADGKPIHSLWKRTGLSHRSANRFPTATPDQAVYTQSHNACCEYPSIPFLSIIKEKRNKKKRAGVQPLDECVLVLNGKPCLCSNIVNNDL